MATKKQTKSPNHNVNTNNNNINVNINLEQPKSPAEDSGKKGFSALVKTHKVLSASLGLFIAVVAVIGIVSKWRTKDVTGRWHLHFKNETSSYQPYIGEIHTQEVYFTQNEKSVTGNGEKIAYNGSSLPSSKHRKLEYTGKMDGKKFIATYKLYGEKRTSTGQIHLTLSDDGDALEGTYTGTAGNCTGSVTGTRLD